MSLGIAEIDAQHRELVDLLNRLFVSVVQRDKDTVTVQILDALLDYTKTHFVLEENLMRRSGYDGVKYATHQDEHQRFVEQVARVAHKNLAEGKSVSFELIHFLKRWLRDHILVADKQYAQTVIAAGVLCSEMPTRNAPADALPAAMLKAPESGKSPWWKVW